MAKLKTAYDFFCLHAQKTNSFEAAAAAHEARSQMGEGKDAHIDILMCQML